MGAILVKSIRADLSMCRLAKIEFLNIALVFAQTLEMMLMLLLWRARFCFTHITYIKNSIMCAVIR